MGSRIYGESDDSWVIEIDGKVRGKYASSMDMACHFANILEQYDTLLEAAKDVVFEAGETPDVEYEGTPIGFDVPIEFIEKLRSAVSSR